MPSIEAAATRAALKAIDPAVTIGAILMEGKRHGAFNPVQGAHASDPQEGVFIDSNTPGWYWERLFTGPLNPCWFGAKGDESQFDSPYIQAAIDFAPSGPYPAAVHIPLGRYLMTGDLTITNRSMVLIGDGRGATRLRWWDGAGGSAGGIFFSTSDILNEFTCRDMTLMTDFVGGAVGIKGSWPAVGSGQNRTCLVENVSIIGTLPTSDYWGQGINLSHAWNAIVRGNLVQGSAPSGATTEAIALGGMCGDAMVTDNTVYSVQTGINVGGTTEGAKIVDNTIVGVSYGVRVATTAGRPGTAISRNHIAANIFGIYTWEAVQISICENLVYGGLDGFIGIYMDSNGDDCRITGNLVKRASGTGTMTGVNVGDAANATVVANHFDGITTGVVLETGSSGCVVSLNHRTNGSTTVADSGSGNTVLNNVP